jgi:hypothetical protein
MRRINTGTKRDYSNCVGKKFGLLTIIGFPYKPPNKKQKCLCHCDCGNDKEMYFYDVESGRVLGCGCLRLRNKNSFVKDLSGERFGSFIVVSFAYGKDKISHWHCRCDCGKTMIVSQQRLRDRRSCGCKTKIGRKRDISGLKFGSLTAQCVDTIKNGATYWVCLCDCGRTKSIPMASLTRGNTRSCGCLTNKLKEETSMLHYGVPYPQQNTILAVKTSRSANRHHIAKHWFSNEDVVCIGSYEKRVVERFNANHTNYLWQHQTFTMPADEDGKIRTYRPDCYLPDQDLWIEIKGFFRGNSKKKWDWFHKEHPNSELWDKSKLKEMGIL